MKSEKAIEKKVEPAKSKHSLQKSRKTPEIGPSNRQSSPQHHDVG